MNLILLGMPGAGKGTQAEFIQKDFGLANISTGAMMREVSRSESELSSKVQFYLSSGTLVPNEIIVEMLVERIRQDDCSNGFLLDGFPRNFDQGKALDNANISIDLVLYLNIKEEEIISRMSGRTGFAFVILIQFAEAMNEFVGVTTLCDSPIPNAINEICNAPFPELTDAAYFVPVYLANSSSNFETLSPPTNDSFLKA